MSDASWQKIYEDTNMGAHDFSRAPFSISAADIKRAVQNFRRTAEKEVRILCKQDTRESRPAVFREKGLFILPVKNGYYNIVRGEGYVDIPDIAGTPQVYESAFPFRLLSSEVGGSEMQHLDFGYAVSLVRHFMQDPSLVLTIRGRKFTPEFNFVVHDSKSKRRHSIAVKSVQTEVDGGYEGKEQIVLIEAKSGRTKNTIIRQLYYPFRQWHENTGGQKEVRTLFFEKDSELYKFWVFGFRDPSDYNSIYLINKRAYKIKFSNL